MYKWLIGLLLFFASLLNPKITLAHSFGKLYNLPVPFWLYLYGGAAALVVSFLVIGYFFNKTSAGLKYPILNLPSFFINPRFIASMRLISVFLLLLTIISGIVGEDAAYLNFNMTFFWIIFSLGLAYLSAIVGNVYTFINPWRVIVEWVENIIPDPIRGVIKYPKFLGYFPALIFYFIFIWVELFGQTGPKSLSLILIQYSMINFLGVFLIGKDNWFKYGEAFSVFFRMIGKLAPVELILNSEGKPKQLLLRPPFVGLMSSKAENFSLIIFILFMLSSTAYDGFRETVLWYRFYWDNFSDLINYDLFQTVGLIVSPLVFLLIYIFFIYLTKLVTQVKISVRELARQFAFSLIPIAFVYNVAHYYTLILTEGQNFIRIISDPFGFGWNIFNTAGYMPSINFIDAGVTWHIQVGLILIGHIVSVYLAHITALKIFPSHKKALLSQLPMLFLMVAFSVIGLWIMSQPITGGEM